MSRNGNAKAWMRPQDLLQLSARSLYHLSGGFRNGPLSENGSISDLSAEESGPSAACSDYYAGSES